MTDGKKFFLSHSTKDEKIVLKVAEKLGADLCWLYQWETKAGDSIFKYDIGIADSKIFLLFWSESAAKSPWVKEEVDELRFRMKIDEGYRPVVVRLDNTPLPTFLQTRSYINGSLGLFHIINKICEVESDLTPSETFIGQPSLKDYFQDRQKLFDQFEDFAASEQYSGIIVLGIDGIGKTTFVKQAISRIFFQLNPIWVDLKIESTPVRLLSAIAKPFGIIINLEEIGRNPESFWKNNILPEIVKSQTSFLVLDNLTLPGRDPTLKGEQIIKLLKIICKDLADHKKKENPTIIVISSTIPNEIENSLVKYAPIHLDNLDKRDVARALKYHLSKLTSLKIEKEKIEVLAEKLRGYPLAIIIAANRVAERGIDVVIEDKALLRDMLFELAQDLFSGITLTDDEKEIMVVLSTSINPLNSKQLKSIFGDKWTIVGDLAKKQLLDPTISNYKLHPILTDYVKNAIATSEKVFQAHSQLTDVFEQEWKDSPEKSSAAAKYGSLAFYHSVSSGRFQDAQKIRVEFLVEAKDAAIELYRLRKYSIALAYLENARKMTEFSDPIYDYYYALCLHRVGRDKEALPIISELTDQFPDISRYYHSLGLIQLRLNKNADAEKSFRTAIVVAHSERAKMVPIVNLADLLFQQGELKESKELITKAQKIDAHNSFFVSVATKIYLAVGEQEQALDILSEALRVNPSDTHLHHRAGMVLKDMGKFDDAIEHLQYATADPALGYSSTALADVYLRLNNLDKAEIAIEKFVGSKDRNVSYLTTKANILRKREKFEESNELLQKAIKIASNDAVVYGVLAQLRLDQTNHALKKDQKQESFIFIAEAKKYINLGLQIDPKNEALLSTNHVINELMIKIGFK
jgi:tetratricopeptide (TPR) repeat protein